LGFRSVIARRFRRQICSSGPSSRRAAARRSCRTPSESGRWLKLMYAAVIRAADRWRGITVGEFEQRQLLAIRAELNRAHAERVKPAVTSAATPVVRKLRR